MQESERFETASAEARSRVRRVLVVDENAVVSGVVGELLNHLGYHALLCNSADAAMVLCRQARIDLVLTEVGLQLDSGGGFIATLAEELPGLPVVVLTGWMDHPEARAAEDGELSRVLFKPVRLEDLGRACQAVLEAAPDA
ncbi:MAG: response regulator [Armatimonadetes bacterium]|nr:response regulator [Armatimonadota bacterium]